MTASPLTIPILPSIKQLDANYKAWLVDIWGVMHDGLHAHAHAVAATRHYRREGGLVVLLSNSPRPSPEVKQQLQALGVPDDAYDATVTSGDLTRHELAKSPGARVFHLGPPRDLPIFAGLDLTLVAESEADIVVCTGLFDDRTETPADYTGLLQNLAARKLPMICANPDHRVERGRDLIYCAGALADVYERMGGSVIYAGKPYAPIYALAFETIAKSAGRQMQRGEVLAVGDGVMTDMVGASSYGLDAVFIASGLHVAMTDSEEALDELAIAELFAGRKRPLAAMRRLCW